MKFKYVPAALLIGIIWSQSAFAGSEFENGVSSFSKRDYKTALVHFNKALATNPMDANAIYYMALCSSQLGNKTRAEAAYATLIKSFPTSEAARNAQVALSYSNPAYLHQLLPRKSFRQGCPQVGMTMSGRHVISDYNGGISATNDLSSLPDQSKIYFENEGKNLLINASVNGRPLKMLFDSGAETVAIGKNHLAELGIQLPANAISGKVYGVGDGGAQQAYAMRVDLKVGSIERKNFPITVQEEMPTRPLLGESFFNAFTYEVDNGAKSITFTKKNAAGTIASQNDRNVIPFIHEGNELVVQVDVNGRSIPMYLDTGAEAIYFTSDQARSIGLEVPEDAQKSISMGIAGRSISRTFVIPRMQCGPSIKNDVTVTVADPSEVEEGGQKPHKGAMRHPLLGQEFFGDLRISVDNQTGVIRLRR